MGLEKRATLTVGVEGAGPARRELESLARSSEAIGKALGGGATGFLKEAAGNLARLGSEFASAATGMKALDFGEAKNRAKAFEEQVTRLALRSGKDIGALAGEIKGVAVEMGRAPEDVASLAKEFGKLSYDAAGGVEAIRQIGDKAQRSGRNVEELMPVGAALARSFGTASQNMGEGFERIRQLSGALKTAGGERGFQEMIVALGPQLEMMGLRTDEARNKMLAFTGVFAQAGKNPAQAQAFGQQAAGMLEGIDPVLMEKTLGYDPYNETGTIEDPAKVMRQLYQKGARRLGGAKGKALRMALRRQFGTRLGSVIYHGGQGMFDEADRQRKALDTATHMQEGGALYLGNVGEEATPEQRREMEAITGRGGLRRTAAGQRRIREAEKANVQLEVGGYTAKVEDAYQDQFKGNRGAQAAIETTVGKVLPGSAGAVVTGLAAAGAASAAGTQPAITPGEARTHALLERVVQAQEKTATAVKSQVPGAIDLGTRTELNKATMGTRQGY